MALSRDLALTPIEQEEILRQQWNMRISTISPSGRINATPLWFVWHAGKVWAYCRGRKVENLRLNPQCTVLIDRAERYQELQGIMIQGEGRVLEDASAEAGEPDFDTVRALYGAKYSAGRGKQTESESEPSSSTARGRNWRWVVITPVRVVTWDNTKLPAPGG
jgi:nitroimidazol reductase NimA-like FMN-containing flavoprotein (pyridoxamine 5'-phosphate oxidase superfamily)